MLWYRLRQLKSTDKSYRQRAVQKLGASDSPRALEARVAALDDRAFTVRAEAAKALGRIKSPDTIEPLRAALADEYATVRQAVVRALQAIGGAAVVNAVAVALSDDEDAVRRPAVAALTEMRLPEAERVLIEYREREEVQNRLAEEVKRAREREEEQKRLAEQVTQVRWREEVQKRRAEQVTGVGEREQEQRRLAELARQPAGTWEVIEGAEATKEALSLHIFGQRDGNAAIVRFQSPLSIHLNKSTSQAVMLKGVATCPCGRSFDFAKRHAYARMRVGFPDQWCTACGALIQLASSTGMGRDTDVILEVVVPNYSVSIAHGRLPTIRLTSISLVPRSGDEMLIGSSQDE